MTPEREIEYNELLAYIGFFATAVWQIDPASGTNSANVINGIVQQFGKSKALVGLRQAANDAVEERVIGIVKRELLSTRRVLLLASSL